MTRFCTSNNENFITSDELEFIVNNEIYEYIEFVTSDNDYFLDSNDNYFTVKSVIKNQIVFYKYTGENNRINKDLYLIPLMTLEGTLKDECSVTSPSILIELDTYPDFNYVYLPFFNRYYFVDSIDVVRTNLWRINLLIDVLYTYKDEILNLEAYVDRNEYDFNWLLEDNQQPFYNKPTLQIIRARDTIFNIDSGYSQYRYVVTGNIRLPFADGYIGADEDTTVTMKQFFCSNVPIIMPQNNIEEVAQQLTNSEWYNYIGKIFANNPLECIMSLQCFPIDFMGLYKKNYLNEYDNSVKSWPYISFGTYKITTPNDNMIAPGLVTDYSKFKVCEFDLTNYGKKWYDFKDNISLYLPFYGFIKLDSKDVYGYKIILEANINIFDGNITYILQRYRNYTKELINTYNCDISINIPLTYNNMAEKFRNTILSSINYAATENYEQRVPHRPTTPVISGFAKRLIGVATDIADTMTPTYTTKNKYDGAPFSATKLSLYPELHIKHVSPTEHNYGRLYGYPCKKLDKIKNFKGFTKIASVHVEDVNATCEEKQGIEDILITGFIV